MPQPAELSLLCKHLDQLFSSKITGTGADPLAIKRNFLSKAVAAYYLYREAGATLEDAVAATIDGGGDNGIDSIYIGTDNTIWLIQSKYIHTGAGEPDLGDVSKFAKNGVHDLIVGHYSRFLTLGQTLKQRLKNLIERQGGERFKAVLVHTGGGINDDRRRIFGDVEKVFDLHNDGYLKFSNCGLATLHELHCQEFANQHIDCDSFQISDFGMLNQPYKAFYGKMKVKDICELGRQHKDNLVEKNIRRYKGTTKVNQEISNTLKNEAERFFYFNNGITFLCHDAQPIGRDPSRTTCTLRVRDLSVINGAQTIGTIASFDPSLFEAASPEVLVTLICLGNAEDEFSERVTQYRNLQNAIDLKDFSSLDQRQYAWQETLSLAGYVYIVKAGHRDPKPSERVIRLKDAAIYLACAYSGKDKWADYVRAAKMDQDRLFKRPTTQRGRQHLLDGAYDELFRDSLTAHQLWRISQIGRIIEGIIKARAAAEVDSTLLPAGRLRAKDILEAAVYFLLHLVFTQSSDIIQAEGFDVSLAHQQQLSHLIDNLCQHLVSVVQSQTWSKQASSLFNNINAFKPLKDQVLGRLRATTTIAPANVIQSPQAPQSSDSATVAE